MDASEYLDYPAIRTDIFRRALLRFDVTIDHAKRSPPGTLEIQRGMRVQFVYLLENDTHVPPLMIESLCRELDIQPDALWIEARKLIDAEAERDVLVPQPRAVELRSAEQQPAAESGATPPGS